MASKTITISKEAYERLRARKEENESFTDVIEHLTRERPLSEIAGVLSKDEADRLRKTIEKRRGRTREGMDDTKERLEDDS